MVNIRTSIDPTTELCGTKEVAIPGFEHTPATSVL